jgi:hypothetical protein
MHGQQLPPTILSRNRSHLHISASLAIFGVAPECPQFSKVKEEHSSLASKASFDLLINFLECTLQSIPRETEVKIVIDRLDQCCWGDEIDEDKSQWWRRWRLFLG